MSGEKRGLWQSRMGFVLAASGAAVGLGNIWRFPYIMGENGGGLFVLLYLGCIAIVGFPILIAELVMGRATGRSPVGAFANLMGKKTPWRGLGVLGVFVGVWSLSFYSVVSGWAMHYCVLAATGVFSDHTPETIPDVFTSVAENGRLSITWMIIFITINILIVMGGVRKGLERMCRILMPLLLVLFLILLVKVMTLSGFGEAFRFIFSLNAENLTADGILEALGHSFFTLSVGVGAMLTYGSYLRPEVNIVGAAATIALLDTLVALLACMVMFPIIFTFGMEPSQGPGLIFINLPIAFMQMPGGNLLATVFFLLIVFAAVTSSISMLELGVSYFIDERGWGRFKATFVVSQVIFLLGIPAALAQSTYLFGDGMREWIGKNWFDFAVDTVSNWLMPLGGFGFAIFVAWLMTDAVRKQQFTNHEFWDKLYGPWLFTLRYIAPLAVLLVFLRAIGVL